MHVAVRGGNNYYRLCSLATPTTYRSPSENIKQAQITLTNFPSHPIPENKMYTILLLLTSACLAHAGIAQQDFTGIGNIYVLQSDNWQTATPKQKVGCLDDHGKFVSNNTGAHTCGVYSRSADFPYTLSTKQGNCTFEDATQERNTDSMYGQSDYAWNCAAGYTSGIYDELYTVVCILQSSPCADMMLIILPDWLPICFLVLRRCCMLL